MNNIENTTQPSWEQEFDIEFITDDEDHIECVHDSPRLLKAFIHKTLHTDRQQLIEAINDMKLDYSDDEYPGDTIMVLNRVIELLKEFRINSDKEKI